MSEAVRVRERAKFARGRRTECAWLAGRVERVRKLGSSGWSSWMVDGFEKGSVKGLDGG